MPVSTSITQCIPTIHNLYLSAELGIDKLTTLPLPSIIESIKCAIESTNDTIGSDIKSYLVPSNLNLHNITNLIGDMSLVSSSIQHILNTLEMTNAKVGDLSNIVSTALPTLESMLGVSLSNNLSINNIINAIDHVFGISGSVITKQYSTTLTHHNLILGDRTNETAAVQSRLVSLEANSTNVLGVISSILSSNLNVAT